MRKTTRTKKATQDTGDQAVAVAEAPAQAETAAAPADELPVAEAAQADVPAASAEEAPTEAPAEAEGADAPAADSAAEASADAAAPSQAAAAAPAPARPKAPVASGMLAELSASGVLKLAAEVRSAATPDSLLFNYLLTAGKVKDRHIASLRKVFAAAVDMEHHLWPAELKGLFYRKDVLHFGCGATLNGPVFRALGAASYAGIDANIDPVRKKFRSRREKRTVDQSFSLVDVMGLMPGLTYMRGEDVIFTDAFDLMVMQSVTQKLMDLDAAFASFHAALRPRGEIWFLHENFYAWAGHQMAPRSPDKYDANDPAQAQLADWGHIAFRPEGEEHPLTKLNRVTPAQLRRTVDTYFEVSQWQEVKDRSAIAERITDDLRRQLPELGLSEGDLLTKQIICRGVRRARPL